MSTEQPARVVVGIDDSVVGLRALRLAVAEARRRGSELHAVRAYTVSAPAGIEMPEVRGYIIALARATVQRALTSIGGCPPDLRVLVALREGNPAWALTEYAGRDDDLLVVGSSRRSPLKRLMHRSIAAHCASYARCPVLVVPPDAFARDAHRTMKAIRHDVERLAADLESPWTGSRDGTSRPRKPGRTIDTDLDQ
jgi:nucleotide-binding universal stress UspA family protein